MAGGTQNLHGKLVRQCGEFQQTFSRREGEIKEGVN